MPPEARAPVFTVKRPIRIGPSPALALSGAATLDRPMPATAVTNPRREIPMISSPCASLDHPLRQLFWLLLAICNNRNQDVIKALAVDVELGRSCEQPARPIARIIVQKWPASQTLVLELGQVWT